MEEGREEKNETVKDTELELERLTGELTAEHLNIVEKFAATIDVGYEYMVQATLLSVTYNAKKESEQRSVLVDIHGFLRSGSRLIDNGPQKLEDQEM